MGHRGEQHQQWPPHGSRRVAPLGGGGPLPALHRRVRVLPAGQRRGRRRIHGRQALIQGPVGQSGSTTWWPGSTTRQPRSMTWWPRSALQCSPAPYHFPPPHYRIPSLLVPCRQQAVLGSNGIPARPHLHTVPPLPTSAPGTGSGQQRGGQLRLRAAARACGRADVAACRCGTQVHAARARPSGVVPLQVRWAVGAAASLIGLF